jgi:hypothetical protein
MTGRMTPHFCEYVTTEIDSARFGAFDRMISNRGPARRQPGVADRDSYRRTAILPVAVRLPEEIRTK